MARYFVVGADGLIGSALMAILQASGKQVIGTSRRRDGSDFVYLDLAADANAIASQLRMPKVAERGAACTAYLAASITGIARCESDPSSTWRVNVINTLQVARTLRELGAHVVFLSSNAVFSGREAYPDERSVPDPQTEYGRQKAAVEDELRRWASESGQPAISIARLTKVVTARMPLFAQWVEAIRGGQDVTAYGDRVLCPVSLFHTLHALLSIANAGAGGLYHVTGASDLTYYEFAELMRKELNGVRPVLRGCASVTPAVHQPHSALCPTRAGNAVGIVPQATYDAVRHVAHAIDL